MIKSLLAYQEKDKQRRILAASVEDGRVKREIDTSSRALDDARRNLLTLENDAKGLVSAFASASKNLKELLDRVEGAKRVAEKAATEDQIQAAIADMSALLEKVKSYESQLDEISKRISQKTAQFEDAKNTVVRAQRTVATLTPEYQKQLGAIAPKLAELDAELNKLAAAVDRELLEKYKQRRRTDKSGKISDIAVAVSGNRCGGCYHEMPTLLVHKIKTNGYIICENCGKIIY